MRQARHKATAIAVALVLLPALSCGLGGESAKPVPVLATLAPLAMIASEVAGPELETGFLVPSGASPHSYEPSPGDMKRVAAARLWIRAGGGIDDWAKRLEGALGEGAETLVANRAQVEHGRFDRRHDDPHHWLDPIWVRDVFVPALVERLAAIEPESKREFRNRGEKFRIGLTHLDRKLKGILGRAPGRGYVAFHGAWRPFAKRYRLKELAVVQGSPGEEPSPREVATVIERARAAGVRAILVEPQLDPRLAEVLARDFGGRTVTVDPLGYSRPELSSYEALMLSNARAFAKALSRAPK